MQNRDYTTIAIFSKGENVGKSTVTSWIKEFLPASYKSQPVVSARLGFADPIKKAVADMLGVPRELLDNREFKTTPIRGSKVSPRVLTDLLAAKLLEADEELPFYIWDTELKKLIENLAFLGNAHPAILVEDGRLEMPEGLAMAKTHGFTIVLEKKNNEDGVPAIFAQFYWKQALLAEENWTTIPIGRSIVSKFLLSIF